MQLAKRWGSLAKFLGDQRSERTIVGYFAQWRACYQAEVRYRQIVEAFNSKMLKRRVVRLLARNVDRERRIKKVSASNRQKREDKARRVAMIALRGLAQYSKAKKTAIEKAF